MYDNIYTGPSRLDQYRGSVISPIGTSSTGTVTGTRAAGEYQTEGNRYTSPTTSTETIRAGAQENLVTLMKQDPSAGYADRLQQMLQGGFTEDDPSYQWRFDQGQQALERSQAARGFLGSGNAAQELVAYGQGAASTEYAAQFNRLAQALGLSENAFSQNYNRLAELAGMSTGMTSVLTQGSIAHNNLVQQKQAFAAQQEAANTADQVFAQMVSGYMPSAGGVATDAFGGVPMTNSGWGY